MNLLPFFGITLSFGKRKVTQGTVVFPEDILECPNSPTQFYLCLPASRTGMNFSLIYCMFKSTEEKQYSKIQMIFRPQQQSHA
jgi:hypothetical protein